MAPAAIFVPEPPVMHGALAPLPDSLKAQWKDTYLKAHKQAAVDSPNEVGTHPMRALKAANQLLAVTKPTSYAEAMAMPEWQVKKRETRNVGTEAEPAMNLVLVTIEGRGPEPESEDEPRKSKFSFAVPNGGDAEAEDEKKSGRGRRAAPGSATN